MFRPHNLPKLATKEDPLHIHKTLGVICLANYGYRYYLLFAHGTMELDNTAAIILLGCHAALSTSSLVFHIPSVRNPKAPMIYPEYRLHSILFVWRSVVCFLLTYYGADMVYRFAACIATMYLADSITSIYPTVTTTMRNMPFDQTVDNELQLRITRMQSAQQIGAMLYMLGNLDSCFSPMLAIQIAAFLMTMVRKNIIDSNTWHAVYNLSLWINIFCFWSLPLEYVVVQPFVNYGVYYWRFSNDRRTHQKLLRTTLSGVSSNSVLHNKYLGLTAAYLVFRSGVGEKIAIIIRGVGNLEAIIRTAIILLYIAAQIVNLTPRRRM